jgi:transcriptional regulator with XRE-family HTH domain
MENEIDAEIGKRVRTFRRLRGLTQSDLGDASGVKFQQIQKYETGQNRIACSKIWLIAEVLGVSVADFFSDIFPTKMPVKNVEAKGLIEIIEDPAMMSLCIAFEKLNSRNKAAFMDLLVAVSKGSG